MAKTTLDPLDNIAGLDPNPTYAGGGRGGSPTAFTAWRRRPGGCWTPVAERATEAECWQALYALMARSIGHHDSIVLPAGKHP